MIEKVFVCDKCAARVPIDDAKPMRITDIVVLVGYNAGSKAARYTAQWCDTCALKSGFLQARTQTEAETAKAAKEPTLDDLLIQMLEKKGFIRDSTK